MGGRWQRRTASWDDGQMPRDVMRVAAAAAQMVVHAAVVQQHASVATRRGGCSLFDIGGGVQLLHSLYSVLFDVSTRIVRRE